MKKESNIACTPLGCEQFAKKIKLKKANHTVMTGFLP
jgi:hypothetical protein